jgi:hypothetical protein
VTALNATFGDGRYRVEALLQGKGLRQLYRGRAERYQSMPLAAALARMFETGRVYRDATTLVDPSTGGEWHTVSPARPRTPPATRG